MKILQVGALAFFAPLASAGVLVVDANGPGPYTQIQAAVSAASDGDVLLVKTGDYARVEIVDKELAIVADVGATVRVGGMRVMNVAATRTVLLSGLVIEGVGHSYPQSWGLEVLTSSGIVFLEACRVSGSQSDCCAQAPAARFVDAAGVVIVRSTLQGSTGGTEHYYGGSGCVASDSFVALYDSVVLGGNGGQDCCCGYGYGYTGSGGISVGASHGFTFVSGSTIAGGDGGDAFPACFWDTFNVGGRGGDGLGTSGAAWLLDAIVTAGQGGTNNQLPGHAPDGMPIVTSGSGSVTSLAPSARTFTHARVVREQQSATLSFTGVAGDDVRLLAGDRPAFRWQLERNGVCALSRRRPQLEGQLGALGPSGGLAGSYAIGELGPGTQARVQYLQAYVVDVQGVRVLAAPHAVVLLDSAY